MDKIRGYIINVINNMKPFLKRIKIFMDLIYKTIKNILKRIVEVYIKLNKKSKAFEPVFVITLSCIFVLIFILFLKNFKSVEEVSLARNSAEAFYYENKYEDAIKEYTKMQDDDEWPIYSAKIADLYSLRGEIEKSNDLLKEVIIKRDKIITEQDYENIKDKDRELINSVILTFTLNKNYDDAISLGEDYINEYGKDNKIISTLFLAYLSNEEINNAKRIIDDYDYNKENAYDLAYIANMKMLTKNYNEGLDLLKDAINIDKNELKIYDVVDNIYAFNKDELIDSLKEKLQIKDNYEYKILLARAYSNSKIYSNDAIEIINSLDIDNDSIGVNLIKYNAYKNINNKEFMNCLEDAISKSKEVNKDSYITYYLLGVQALENNKFDDALSNAKKSVGLNNNYLKSYSYLIPKIYIGKGQFDSIEGYYRKALESEPFNYKLIVDIADYYSNYETSNDKAEYYYNLALNIRNNDDTLYKKIADLNMRDNNIEEAINNLKNAIEANEENGDYYRILGAIYLNNEDYEEGIKFTRKAYEINSEDVKALNNAAWYYLFVENNIERSYENIKSAFNDITNSISEEDKNIIIENYTQVKRAYEREEKLDKYNSTNTLFNLVY